MKQIFYVIALSLMFVAQGNAQESYAPTKVVKAAFFDKTPALIDMPIIQPSPDDNNWKDGLVENETVDFGKGLNKGYITDPSSVQDKMGSLKGKGPIVGVAGTGNVNGVYPPDTDGDVGPNHYFQMINLSFAIYDKNGTKLYGPVANSTLWSGFPGPWSGHNDGDPVVIYDELADRWVASQFAVNASNGKHYEMIAVSETADPLGSYNRYAFEFDMFPDYPKLGVWSDGYYATFHMFQGNFQGSAMVAFERDKMLIGDPDAQMIYFGEYGSRFGFLPADLDGDPPPAGTPCNFVGINFFGNHSMEVWEMIPDWTNTANSSFQLVKVLSPNSFNANISGIPQPGTSQQIDGLNNNLMYRLPYRYFADHQSIVATHTIKVGSTVGVRWYELRHENADWSIYQQGTYMPDNDNRWMASIAMAANGSIALGYTVSSSTTYPSMRYTGRTSDAPLGEMNIEEVELKGGSSSQNGISRWGDYSCMSADHTNDGVFWYTSEYMKSNGWGTWISSFDFNDLLPPTAFAGDDDTICENTLFETSATGLYYSAVLWETSGDGNFQNPSVLDAKYLRGNGDIANGGVTLSLTTYGFQTGWEATDDVYVTILKEVMADAGNDTTVNPNIPVMLNASAESYSALLWETDGDGTFDDETLLQATYTAGPNDITAGEVNLTLTATAISPCEGDDADQVHVVLDPTVGISKSLADVELQIIPNPSNGIFRVNVKSQQTDTYDLIISNLEGKMIYFKRFEPQTGFVQDVDISTYPKGIYLLEIKSNGLNRVERIIKK